MLPRASSTVRSDRLDAYFDAEGGDVVDVHEWKCVRTINDTVFEVILSPDRLKRYEWDTLTSDLELVDSVNGHFDVVYGTFDPRYLTCFDLEISNLSASSSSNSARCLVTQTLEINTKGWNKWRNSHCPKFEKTVPYALLSQVAGVKEYIGANPALHLEESTTSFHAKVREFSRSDSEFEDTDEADEFYDAIAASSSSDEDDSETDIEFDEDKKLQIKSISLGSASLSVPWDSAAAENNELDSNEPAMDLHPSQFRGSMRKAKDESDKNCWSSLDGSGFMIRGKTYLKDSTKVKGGEPLLRLIAVDWLKAEDPLSKVALHPKSLVQSEVGRKLPFVLVINLQGYWMVKRAVGTKACLLGKAVACKYLRQDNFLEIDVDIGSSSVARSVVGLVLGYVTSLVVDLAIVIEAKEEAELPEYVLGTVRLNRVSPDSAEQLDA
ncbi:UNVERIFIED_CONTAM: protein ENHANCED DISEASE RESISTANCE 2 [Sesamum calycinum]|uniref:Protein ENHANCED DISEASE RESISTANCE 2 n=1 Tax=Sesamum calycinum TaxID=2727403 RepID=A0AAW2RSX0_9LAMI